MTNIVSIDWSVEEFRRLIGEQPQSSRADSPLDKTIRVLSFEVGPPSTDPFPTMYGTDSPDVEVAGEELLSLHMAEVVATKKDNSSDWTVVDVIPMAAVQGEQSEELTSSRESAGTQAEDTVLHIRDVEVVLPRQATDRLSTNESARSSEIETAAPDAGTDEEGTVSDARIEPDASKALEASNWLIINPPAPSVLAEAPRMESRSTLEKAIAEPDIHTSRADRIRAIDLRWILRDIRGNRLKWSPPREHDLKVLIEFDLVEMRDGIPQLTNAGVNAII